MVGAFLALGMPAEVVLPAVLAYRAVAIWTPVPAGAAALAGLRRRVRVWADEDGIEHAEEELATIIPMPVPVRLREHDAVPLAA
jgi:cell wall assembly regulator SMI1